MNSYKRAEKYLGSLINYEKLKSFSYRNSFKLERVEKLFKALGVDASKLKAVHIAGTKGKGSTANFMASVLAFSGYKTGLYTSPHFDSFRERIVLTFPSKEKLKYKLIPKQDLSILVSGLKEKVEKLSSNVAEEVSFFEAYTAIAFKYFLKEKTDFSVVECGLGGRLDATNLLCPEVSLITRIGFDHTLQLGRRLTDIASEKAGIIKRNIPVIVSLNSRKVSDILVKRAKSLNASLFLYGRDFTVEKVRFYLNLTSFDLRSSLGVLRGLTIRMKGKTQVENAALAAFSFLVLKKKYPISGEGIYRGLERMKISGRFEAKKFRGRDIVLDIAHNPSSFKSLSDNIKEYFPEKKIVLIFGCSKRKDYRKMLRDFPAEKIILTRSSNPRALSPEEINKAVKIRSAKVIENISDALNSALCSLGQNRVIVVSGSVFLVAEIRRMIVNGKYGR